MSSEKALRRKVIVNALCTFFTGKPFDPPLESNDFYFRYNFNKLVFLFFFVFPFFLVVQSTSKAINRKR